MSSNPIPASGLDRLADGRTSHTCASWNARRHQIIADAHEVLGTVYSGPTGQELGPRLQEVWRVEASQLLADLCTAIEHLPADQLLAFEQTCHNAVHEATMRAMPEAETEPRDAVAALDAQRGNGTGQVPATT
jgi:hypothetical protein